MAHSFDLEGLIKSTFKKALVLSNLLLVLYINSKSLYNCLVKLGTMQEKCLMIDVICLCQAYKRCEISEVRWIKGDSNLANSITKVKPSLALKRLIEDNIV
jgi:hypothetical protein